MKAIQTAVRKYLAVFLAVTMLAPQVFQINAYASKGDLPTLASVIVDGQTHSFPEGDTVIRLADSLDSAPCFELKFTNNMQNEEFLSDNLDKISIYSVDTDEPQTLHKYPGDTGDNGILCAQALGLDDGDYALVVEAGVEANAGPTENEYTIYFTVGEEEDPTLPDEGEQPEGTYKVTFKISGVSDTTYSILVRKNGVVVQPSGDDTYYLEDGLYEYVVSASGYVAQQGQLLVEGEDTTVSLKMVDYVLVTFTVEPSNATLRVKYGQEDYLEPESGLTWKLTPGVEYTYVAEAEGYTTDAMRFTPLNNETRSVVLEEAEAVDGYTWQGNGGNTLLMTTPDAQYITVREDVTDYAYNIISSDFSYDPTQPIDFYFTMGAGINAYNDTNFLNNSMGHIAIYQSFEDGQPVGSPLAEYDGGSGDLQYRGFSDRTISIGVDAGVLADGTYVIVFGRNVCGNNINKTLGKDIAFQFTVGDGTDVDVPDGGDTEQPGGDTEQPGGGTEQPGGDTEQPGGDGGSSGGSGSGGSGGSGSGDTETPDTETPDTETPSVELPYTDVASDAWYYKAAGYMYEKGLMSGVTETAFGPNQTLTRGMIAQILYNLAGQPEAASAGFNDVASDAWYAAAVNWISSSGVASGYGNGTFGPNDNITREQLAVILYNYAVNAGLDVSASADLSGFADLGTMSSWAGNAMKWAVGAGMIGGKSADTLAPCSTATRAEVAQILMNFCGLLEQ